MPFHVTRSLIMLMSLSAAFFAPLASAGVPFEVIPGVSSAISAPALAGIPVTHRGLSTGFAVVAGHAGSASGALLDAVAPGAMTLVVLMGVAHRAGTAAHLLARGWSGETPAAIVLGGSSPDAFTWRGTLSELRTSELPPARLHLPGILVIGAVAALNHSNAGALASGPELRAPARA